MLRIDSWYKQESMNLDWFTIYSEAHSYQIKNKKIWYIAIDTEKPGEIHSLHPDFGILLDPDWIRNQQSLEPDTE